MTRSWRDTAADYLRDDNIFLNGKVCRKEVTTMLAKLKKHIGISIVFTIIGACGWLVGKYSNR